MSLRPRPGETAEDTLARVVAAASAPVEIEASLLLSAISTLVPPGDKTTEVSREFMRALIDEVVATEPVCDHSVNICACTEAATLAELRLRLDGLMTCPACGGDGHTWSEEAHSHAAIEYARVHGGTSYDALSLIGDDPGYVKCARCEGRCVIPMGPGA